MNIRELYNKGYRRFKFSDGEVREPNRVDLSDDGACLTFLLGKHGPDIWYDTGGFDNIGGTKPHIVGVEDKSMSSKRDEIQAAIEVSINRSGVLDVEENTASIIKVRDCVMEQLDSLVERWTDEETAEDLDKSIRKSEVYEGMRVRMVAPDDSRVPVGHTGTIVHPDGDGIPAVMWDSADYNTCLRPHNHGERCNHVTVEELEKE